jgi:hypothetical protein
MRCRCVALDSKEKADWSLLDDILPLGILAQAYCSARATVVLSAHIVTQEVPEW